MSGLTTQARAWAIARRDGSLTLGFTDHDMALRFDGIDFRPDSGLSAKAITQGAGLAVDNTEAEGVLSHDAITEADIAAGRWDGASVRLWEVDWRDTAQRRLVFAGHLGEVTRSGLSFRAELRGLGEALARPQGRVYHPRCSAVLGDGACKVDLSREGLTAEALVVAADDLGRLVVTGAEGFDGRWFERGRLDVVDGAAAGLGAAIKADDARPDGSREITLWTNLGAPVAEGDVVRLVAGCDKGVTTCRLKFDNYLNFRGFPHLPPEDWLMAPRAGGQGA